MSEKKVMHLIKFKGNDKYRPLFLLFSKKMIAITTMITTRRPPTAPPTYKDVLLSAFASLFCFGVISEKKNTVHLMKNQGMGELIVSGTNEFVVGKF